MPQDWRKEISYCIQLLNITRIPLTLDLENLLWLLPYTVVAVIVPLFIEIAAI